MPSDELRPFMTAAELEDPAASPLPLPKPDEGEEEGNESGIGLVRAALLGACVLAVCLSAGVVGGTALRRMPLSSSSSSEDTQLGEEGAPSSGDGNDDEVALQRLYVNRDPSASMSSQKSHHGNKHNPVIYTDGMERADVGLMMYLSTSSFGRNKVMDYIVNEYTSPSESSMKKRMDNALEVMELLETDGEPVGVDGHPFLFVGSAGASVNEQALRESGITHIVNWSSTSRCNTFDGIDYLCINDIARYDQLLERLDILDNAVDLIEFARKSGGNVMSQCWYGRNRSVTLLVAYLVKYEGMDSEKALELIQRTRPIADSYRDVLRKYSKHYLPKHYLAAGSRATAKKSESKGGHS